MELTQANTAIVLDSTSDFPEAPARFPNMRVVPLYVRFGDQAYRDYVELSPHEFYERLAGEAALPTTSQPTPQDFADVYGELSAYERIYSLQLSAKLSGTFQSAELAAAQLGDRLRVVDTETASLAIAMLALAIQRQLTRGTTDGELEALIDSFKQRCDVVFTVGTLEYLHKGGRIGRAQALAGTLLNLKPILSIEDGIVIPIGRVRGRQKALEEFARVFVERTEDLPGLRVAIAHAEAPEWIDVITQLVRSRRPRAEIELVGSLGAVVGTHAGPGTVGFFWFQDVEEV
jgi:fatty acid kinase fatty acid binding subunit